MMLNSEYMVRWKALLSAIANPNEAVWPQKRTEPAVVLGNAEGVARQTKEAPLVKEKKI